MLSKLKNTLIAFLGYCLLKLFYLTQSWKIETHPNMPSDWVDRPYILTFWHNKQLFVACVYSENRTKKSPPLNALISAHSDGRLIARIVSLLGVKNIAGSSSRGGRAALNQMISIVNSGESIAITPDGPRGPIYKVKPGVIKIAQKTGAPIYPATVHSKKCWTFNSWDKMILPKPFSKVTFYLDEPLYIPKDLSKDQFRDHMQTLEERLMRIETPNP